MYFTRVRTLNFIQRHFSHLAIRPATLCSMERLFLEFSWKEQACFFIINNYKSFLVACISNISVIPTRSVNVFFSFQKRCSFAMMEFLSIKILLFDLSVRKCLLNKL